MCTRINNKKAKEKPRVYISLESLRYVLEKLIYVLAKFVNEANQGRSSEWANLKWSARSTLKRFISILKDIAIGELDGSSQF